MELVRGLHNMSQRPKGCVLTVGNYDGVHLGHQKMIGVLKQRAAELRSTATVLVFEPSSKEFIDPEGAPPRLTRWREKYPGTRGAGRRSSGDLAVRRDHEDDDAGALCRADCRGFGDAAHRGRK